MTDYLEELLEGTESPEEDPEVLRIGADRMSRRRPDAMAREAAERGGGNSGTAVAAAERRKEAAPVRSAQRPSAGRGPGDLPELVLREAEVAFGGSAREPDGADPETARGGMELPGADVRPARRLWQGGAAALERQVRESLDPKISAVRTVAYAVQPESGAGRTGPEELDRRMERDARRYDGALSLY